jgi:hypothetical protein
MVINGWIMNRVGKYFFWPSGTASFHCETFLVAYVGHGCQEVMSTYLREQWTAKGHTPKLDGGWRPSMWTIRNYPVYSGASTTWYQDICRHIETDQIRTSIIQNRGWLLVHRSHVPQDVSIIVVFNYKLTCWVVCKSLVDAVNVHWVPENGGLNAQKLFQPHFFGDILYLILGYWMVPVCWFPSLCLRCLHWRIGRSETHCREVSGWPHTRGCMYSTNNQRDSTVIKGRIWYGAKLNMVIRQGVDAQQPQKSALVHWWFATLTPLAVDSFHDL